nr:endonuclease G, mitochondrial isoform X2 [Manis javanica]
MKALRAGLCLALGAGLGAAAEGWRRRRADARAAPGLLGRLPVLPVAAAAELPVVPGAPAGSGPGELAKYGLPGLAQLKSRESYVLCYDPRTRGALWVVEQLRPERLRGDGDRRSCDFREDDSVHSYHRATNADYRGSGFDRGHLAAAANHRWSQKAMDDTFYLSNVAPQVAPAPCGGMRGGLVSLGLGLLLCRRGRLPSAFSKSGASPQPECLEQPGEIQPQLDPHLPECLCLYRATLPAQDGG